MTRGIYGLLVVFPHVVVLGIVGNTAKFLESLASKTRRLCAERMRRVLDKAPPRRG